MSALELPIAQDAKASRSERSGKPIGYQVVELIEG
jgi:hypothetical protein